MRMPVGSATALTMRHLEPERRRHLRVAVNHQLGIEPG
jgi:hypothetical protein